MTREEASRYWTARYEAAKNWDDPHWEAQERREHREYVEALRMAIEALSAEADWIPCGEGLPDAEDCPMDCMVTRKSKFVGNYVDMAVAEANGTWTHEDWKAITLDGKATCISTRDADIIAWMPLPPAYKEDDKE